MIFLAWKPEHMLTFLVCVFFFLLLLGLYLNKIHRKKKKSGKEIVVMLKVVIPIYCKD